MKIGILSDTHSYFDPKLKTFFSECDEIWHAGDIGNLSVLTDLEKLCPVLAVHGNIDGQEIRNICPAEQRHNRAGLDIWMIHIGGYPGSYDRRIKERLIENPPDIFISGHSHILKVMPDKKLGLLHINPGAAGYHGLHKVRTAIRFSIIDQKPSDLDVIELGPRSIA